MVYLSYSVRKEPLSDYELERQLSQLPLNLQEKVTSFRRREDASNSLMGKIMLRDLAKHFFNIPDILDQLVYSNFGKPYINAPLSFSISHSGNLVVCAVSEIYQLGVDVEQIAKLEFELFQEYMSGKEWEQIWLANNPNKKFLKFWTQKEAAIKADGRGLSIPLNSLTLNNTELSFESQTWHLLELSLRSDYICHLATNRLLTLNDINIIEF